MFGREIPIRNRTKAHAFAFAFDDQANRRRLNPTSRKPRLHFAPQHRRHFVAIEAIERSTCFLSVDQSHVDVARIRNRLGDRLLRNFVKHHAVHRHLGLQLLLQVPGNGLPFAVFVGGEVEVGGVFERVFEITNDVLLGDFIGELEVVFDVDTQTTRRKINNMADRGHHLEIRPKKLANGLRLRGRLNNNERFLRHVALPLC